MKCSNCKNSIIQKTEDKGLKFRVDGPMTADAKGNVLAKCYWCKAAVTLPLELSKGYVEERYVIKTGAKA